MRPGINGDFDSMSSQSQDLEWRVQDHFSVGCGPSLSYAIRWRVGIAIAIGIAIGIAIERDGGDSEIR